MKFAYADPPYLGCCNYYGHNHGDGWRPFDRKCWNDVATHAALINFLVDNYPDGWALSMGSDDIAPIAPLLPSDIHWGAWVKPFASFKPGINPGYCWEPVAFYRGRKLGRDVDTVKDFIVESITLKKGLAGAKPFKVCLWILQMLGFDQFTDTVDDLFPGSGVMGQAVSFRLGVPAEQLSLIGDP